MTSIDELEHRLNIIQDKVFAASVSLDHLKHEESKALEALTKARTENGDM